jgi:hypothetical protein
MLFSVTPVLTYAFLFTANKELAVIIILIRYAGFVIHKKGGKKVNRLKIKKTFQAVLTTMSFSSSLFSIFYVWSIEIIYIWRRDAYSMY